MCYSDGKCKYEKPDGECKLVANDVLRDGFPPDSLCHMAKMDAEYPIFEENGSVIKE
jgi:hypothetical protein